MAPVLHRDRIGLLAALGRLPLKEAVHPHDAAALVVGATEHRLPPDRLRHGVDWLRPALGVAAPGRNEAPFQQIERALAGLMVLTDHKQFLARRAVVAPRDVREPAVWYV